VQLKAGQTSKNTGVLTKAELTKPGTIKPGHSDVG